MARGRILAVLALAAAAPASGQTPQPEARLELALDPAPAAPYVGEMVLGTLRGRYVGNVAGEALEIPEIEGFGWMELSPPDWTQRRVGLGAVNEFTQRLAFFPQSAGLLGIGGIRHRVTFSTAEGRIEMEALAPRVAVEVRAPPATGDAWWIPARAVTLTDAWAPRPDRLGRDEWTVRTVTLEVAGLPPQALPAAPPMYAGGLFTFGDPEARSVALTEDGPVSTVVWRYRMKPQTDAPADLDDIPISWFDTEARAGRSLLLAGRQIAFAHSALPLEPGPIARWSVVGGTAAGAALGLALLLPRLGLRRSPALGRLRAAVRGARAAARLSWAARRGDAARARAALLDLLRVAGVKPEDSATLAALDREIFGRAAAASIPPGLSRAALRELKSAHRPEVAAISA